MDDSNAHPSEDDLIGHLAGGRARLPEIERHLAACAACAETAALFALARETIAADAAEPVPMSAVARAAAVFRERPTTAPASRLRRIVADRVFDSWGRMAPGFAGVRGAADARHLAWQTGDFDIDLQVQRAASGGCRLIGQVDAHDVAPASSCYLSDRSGAAVAVAEIDEFGGFALDAPLGSFDLLLETEDAILVLPGVEVG